MSAITFQVIALLLLANALYVAAEFAIVAVRRNKILLLAEEGDVLATRLLPFLEDGAAIDRAIAACQIGITLTSLILGAYGQATITLQLAPRLAAWGSLEPPTAFSLAALIVLVGLTGLQVVFSELVPKSLALQYPVKTARFTVLPLEWSIAAYSIFIKVLNGAGLAILRLFGVDRIEYRHVHSEKEVELLLAESRKEGLLEPEEHVRLKRALKLGMRAAREVMIPIEEIVAVDVDARIDEVLATAAKSPYTRLPVYQGTRDRFIGLLHVKDLVLHRLQHGTVSSLRAVLRPVVKVNETVKADELLTLLQKRKSHLAMVTDEKDRTIGLITLEDVLAEVLGDVGDEFKASTIDIPEHLEDGRVRIPGSYSLDEAESWLGVSWKGKSKTVGGFVGEHLEGRITPGSKVNIEGVEVEVERVGRQRVLSILAQKPVVEGEEDVG
ncbi:MAG: HlyC/CorC family transporter [Deltaproteobacteria bacterium]|nr:HlyC/CorC family transporter [Deltaproteobacteria bacterium]